MTVWSLGCHPIRLLVHAQHEVATGKVRPDVRVTVFTTTYRFILLNQEHDMCNMRYRHNIMLVHTDVSVLTVDKVPNSLCTTSTLEYLNQKFGKF